MVGFPDRPISNIAMLGLREPVTLLAIREREGEKLSLKQEGVGCEEERTAGCQAQGAPGLSAGGRPRRRRPSCSKEVEHERKEKSKD